RPGTSQRRQRFLAHMPHPSFVVAADADPPAAGAGDVHRPDYAVLAHQLDGGRVVALFRRGAGANAVRLGRADDLFRGDDRPVRRPLLDHAAVVHERESFPHGSSGAPPRARSHSPRWNRAALRTRDTRDSDNPSTTLISLRRRSSWK